MAATETLTVPLPVWGPAPAATTAHKTLLFAVHEHPVLAVTWKLSVPPSLDTLADAGVTVYEQEDPAVWLIVTVLPAAVIVPLLATPVFANTFTWTVPLPLPAAPELISAQFSPLEAVQLHPVDVATEMLRMPPADEVLKVVGETVDAHDTVG